MAEVFRRPSLTGLEVLWRWVFWVAVLGGKPARALYAAALLVVSTFQAGGFPALGSLLASYPVTIRAGAHGSALPLILALAFYLLLASLGRTLVLRRAGGSLRPRLSVMLLLAAARWLAWAAVIAMWCAGVHAAVGGFVSGPQSRGMEPSWVLLCAVLIASTLVLFVLWLGTTWVFTLMEIFTAGGKPLSVSLREVLRRGPLAGKLAEINLVLGIVKIALLVLAMVFSACPLPFETVETQSFLLTWTAGVLLLYFLASDYFHVVRLLAFVRIKDALMPFPAAAQDGAAAS